MPTVRLTVQAYSYPLYKTRVTANASFARQLAVCSFGSLSLSLSLVVSRSRIPPSTKKKTNASYKSQFLDLIPALSLSASLLFFCVPTRTLHSSTFALFALHLAIFPL